MRTKLSVLVRFAVGLFTIILSLSIVLPLHAAGFIVSPSTFSNNYPGAVTLLITNVPAGATVLVEEFLDANTNGTIDAADLLVQSFRLTDGQVTSFGSVRDMNIPGDEDSVAGQITSSFSFLGSPEFAQVAGTHLFRLSSPTSAFSAVVRAVTVTQAAYGQRITGTITSGGSPVPFAGVGLLVQVGNNAAFVAGAMADSAGNYSLTAPPGAYAIFAVAAGYVSDFGTTVVLVNAGQTTTQNLTMVAGARTISGSVTDAGVGIPAVQLLFQSSTSTLAGLGFSDASGNFIFSVPAGQWKIDFSDRGLTRLGYLRPGTKPRADTTSGNVTGFNIALTKETALVYGNVKNDTNGPLANISMFAGDGGGLYNTSATTDSAGNYTIGVLGGLNWSVGPDSQNPGLSGYSVSGTNLLVNAGQAVQINFVARRVTAHLLGRVIDDNGVPQSGLNIFASAGNGGNSGTTAGDGSFDVGVFGGLWQLQLSTESLSGHNWVLPYLVFNVTDGVNISNITYIVRTATANISGRVQNSQGAGIPGLSVSAIATISGTNYNQIVTTDGSGNYQIGVINATWQMGLDCGAVAALGYSCPTNNFQNVVISGSSSVVNFTLLPPVQLNMYFRHFAYGGEFGTGLTPVSPVPIVFNHYVVVLTAQNGTAYPPPSNVLFTGPAGSGLIGTPADSSVLNANSTTYFSPAVSTPAVAPGGNWGINYNGNNSNLSVADPQAGARLFAPVPTAELDGASMYGVSWVYKSTNGVALGAAPAFVTQIQIQVFDKDLNGVDSSPLLPPTTTSYLFGASYPWSTIGRIRAIYFDTLGNRYFINFNQAVASLSGATQLPNHQFQFSLNGLLGQNYTVQYSTTLTNWNTLYITNAPASLFNVVDPNATGPLRFYRALLGP